jgi:hypothetical protein
VDVFDRHLVGLGQGDVLGPAASTTGTTDGDDGDQGTVTSGGSLLDTGGGSTLTSGGGGSPVYGGGTSSSGGTSSTLSSLTSSSNLPLLIGGFAVVVGLAGVAYYAHRKHMRGG